MDGAETEKQAQAVRAEIIRHAGELFEHYGFSKTNVGDIAKRCAMSPGNLYRYFRNKQDIGRAVVQAFFAMSEAEVETALMLPGGSAEARLRRMMHTGIGHLVREMEENPRIIELAEFICNDEEGIELLNAHIGRREAHFARELARGMATGEFRKGDPAEIANTLHAATKAFWMPMALAHWKVRSDVAPTLDRVLDLIFAGLRSHQQGG